VGHRRRIANVDDGLPCSKDVGVAARAVIRERLGRDLSDEALDDARSVVTELAANAFSHALPLEAIASGSTSRSTTTSFASS